MEDSSTHATNLNRNLKNIKSEIMVDLIHQETSVVTIVTNKVTSALDFQTIENYVKNANHIESTGVEVPCLPQSKLYLKITGIPYLGEFTNASIASDIVQEIFKKNYIFNNIAMVSKPQVIKVSPKSDMSIIWFNIWDVQSRSKAKGLIDRYFNIGSYIVTIRGTNMNLGVSQCKNCWKWGHTTFSCRIQGSRYIKCNGPHKSEHHHHFTWYYKANLKTNLPRLETKQREPYPHIFKCLNCQGNYQANSNQCSFW